MAQTPLDVIKDRSWETNKIYAVNDIVDSGGYLIKCLTAHTSGTLATDVQSGYWQMLSLMKNNIINSNFDFWQRGTTFSGLGSFKYSADRWQAYAGSNTSTVSQVSSIGLNGSTYSLRHRRDDGNTGTDVNRIGYALDASDSKLYISKPVSVSFYMRKGSGFSPANVAVTLHANTGAENSALNINSGVSSLTVVPTTSWVKYVFTGTMPSNLTQIALNFITSACSGTASNDYFEIAQVMLSEGPAPALFQMVGSSYEIEKSLVGRPDDTGNFPLGYDDGLGMLGSPVPLAAKNYLLNGGFDLWQRGTTFSALATNTYFADRWANVSGANTSTTTAQVASALAGSSFSLNWTAGSTSSLLSIAQALESTTVRALLGKVVTFSAICKVSGTNVRTYQLQISKNSTANVLSTGSWTTIATSTATVLTTGFTRLSVTAYIPNDGTVLGLKVAIFDNQTGLATDVISVEQCMLNEGSLPATFQLAGLNLAGETAMCQRYYEIAGFGSTGRWVSATSCVLTGSFQVTKRTASGTLAVFNATPNVQEYSTSLITTRAGTATAISASQTSASGFSGNFNGFTSATGGNAALCVSNLVSYDTELL